jgi:hypothetical protein
MVTRPSALWNPPSARLRGDSKTKAPLLLVEYVEDQLDPRIDYNAHWTFASLIPIISFNSEEVILMAPSIRLASVAPIECF